MDDRSPQAFAQLIKEVGEHRFRLSNLREVREAAKLCSRKQTELQMIKRSIRIAASGHRVRAQTETVYPWVLNDYVALSREVDRLIDEYRVARSKFYRLAKEGEAVVQGVEVSVGETGLLVADPICPHCGAAGEESDIYCSECGGSLAVEPITPEDEALVAEAQEYFDREARRERGRWLLPLFAIGALIALLVVIWWTTTYQG